MRQLQILVGQFQAIKKGLLDIFKPEPDFVDSDFVQTESMGQAKVWVT
jgi:hypothetical protein